MKLSVITATLIILALSLASCSKRGSIEDTESSMNDDPILNDNQYANVENETIFTIHEKLADELMNSGQEVFEVVIEVTDCASARTAATKLSNIESRLNKVYEELKTLDPPPAELRATIRNRMNERDEVMWSLQGKVNTIIKSLDSESSSLLTAAMMKCSAVMENNRDEFQRHFRFDEQ